VRERKSIETFRGPVTHQICVQKSGLRCSHIYCFNRNPRDCDGERFPSQISQQI